MTVVGAGGIQFHKYAYTKRFKKELKKLDAQLKDTAYEKIKSLLKNPRPSGLQLEKLKGYTDPDIYTVHINGNYKISFHIKEDANACIAVLRRVATHNEIDRRP